MSSIPGIDGLITDAAGVDGELQNKLLATLPDIDRERVQRYLVAIPVPAGRILCETGSRLDYAFFPATSILALLHVASDGTSTEVATVGNEGMVGITLFMGGETTANRIVVQSKGYIYRMKSVMLQDEFRRGGAMQRLLLRYTQARLAQISQTAVCNRRHSIEQQLCRWLLLSLDRLDSRELLMTHEMLANTLGVRREGITEAAYKLQCAGLINYRRGRIRVIDRDGVEAWCCECYGVVRREYDHLLDSTADSSRIAPPPSASARAAPSPQVEGSAFFSTV